MASAEPSPALDSQTQATELRLDGFLARYTTRGVESLTRDLVQQKLITDVWCLTPSFTAASLPSAAITFPSPAAAASAQLQLDRAKLGNLMHVATSLLGSCSV